MNSVVAIGGGHGLARTLAAVKDHPGGVAAVVTAADDGGSSGRLRAAADLPPPGDIRMALMASATDTSILSALFDHRFQEGDIAGHSLGNLMLVAMADLLGGFDKAVLAAEEMLAVRGRVLPVALEPLRLEATVGDRRVVGQVAIARARGRISKLAVAPATATANPEVLAAIGSADAVVFSAGSLYTSLLSALVVPGVAEAINQSDAKLILLLNLTTQDGETLGLRGQEHIAALQEVGGVARAGVVLCNEGPVLVPAGLEQVNLSQSEATASGWELHGADLAADDGQWPHHEEAKLKAALEDVL